LQEIGSTQDRARALAADGAEEGTAVIAERQTSGRGRLGRVWVSPPGTNIAVSLVLRPNLKPAEASQIPLIAGIATCKAIERVSALHPRIKWPNDVLLRNKKVAGILAEMGAEVDRLHYIVLGLGINVNTRASLFPAELQPSATSLAEEAGQEVSRVRLLQALFEELEHVYEEFKHSGFGPLRDRWKALDCTLGSWVKAIVGEERIEGQALDIDADGALVLRKQAGEIQRVIAGDVMLTKGPKASSAG
jgi:BirA family biotin operon repressor/biotin-[acetyl-CoA-carboxylase] ligase